MSIYFLQRLPSKSPFFSSSHFNMVYRNNNNNNALWNKLFMIHNRVLNAKNVRRNLKNIPSGNLLMYLVIHPSPEMTIGRPLYVQNKTNRKYKSTLRNTRTSAKRKIILENIEMLKRKY